MAATVIKSNIANITAAAVASTVDGLPSPCHVAVQLVGTFVATVTFEVTANNVDWVSIELMPSTDLTDTALTATATAPGLFVTKAPIAVSGIRARVSAFTSNTSGVMTTRVSCF